MALTQKYGIKYPFSSENLDNVYMDMNETHDDSIKSQVLHVLFTPKGQKLRDPEFGTDLIRHIFAPKDGETIDSIKTEIMGQVNRYVPSVTFEDVSVLSDESSDNGIIVMISYSIKKGTVKEVTTVAVKL